MERFKQNSSPILDDNAQAYRLDSTLIGIIDELVGRPYKNHPKTTAWVQEVVNQDDAYHRRYILQQGRADFTGHVKGLTAEQTVLLYCCYYLQMHLASSRYIFDTCHTAFGGYLPFLDPHSILIDFGCGPLTSAIALACYSAGVGKPKPRLNYVGIERSTAMIEKARQFSQSRSLFCPESNFHFLQNYTDTSALTRLINRFTHPSRGSWVVLNFSYFFASPWLNCEELSATLDHLKKRFPQHRFCIIFQNPPGADLNRKWYQFKNSFASHCQLIAGSSDSYDEVYYYDYYLRGVDGQRLHQSKPPIKLYYEILVE